MCDAYSALMNQVRQVQVPAAQESIDLARSGQVDELVRRNMPMVIRIASRFARNDDERMELIQAGSVGLWKAAERFDPDRGVVFSTYAWHAILHEVVRELKPRKKQMILDRAESWSESLDIPVSDNPSDVEQAAMDAEEWEVIGTERDAVMSAVGELSDIDQIIICRRYGLDGRKRSTLDSLGAEFRVTRERIRQRQARAVKRLRMRLVGAD